MSGPTTVNVSFTLKGGGGYSLQSQPSPQVAFYSSISSSVTTQKLPADIMSHLWGNTSTVTASDLMAKTTLLDCGGVGLTSCQLSETTNPTFMGIFTKPSPGREDYAAAFYYPLSTDTWYKDTSVATPTGVATVLFHAQNAATFPEGNEAVMVIWDQNTCYINSVQQTGCVVGYYHYSGVPGTIYSLPPASGCGTQSNPCNITFTYGSVASNLYAAQDNGYHPSSQSSAQLSPFGGTVREQELQSGAISHAITLAVDCINAGTEWVFPGISNGLGPCGTSYFGPNNVNRPPADSLFFLDYTPTQIANMGLPAWQTTLLTAMSTYGAYVTVTSGNGAGINFAGNDQLESSEAWKYASPTTGCSPSNCYNDPFWLWITGQKGLNGNNNLTQVGCGSESGGTDPSAIRCNGAFLTNIGRIQTATSNSVDAEGNTCSSAGGCYPSGHLHVADQCIAKGYAGIAGGCN
jgi:hypothetical protein